MDMKHTMCLQWSRNGENRKSRRLENSDGVNQHSIEQRFSSYKIRQQSVRFWTRYLSRPNIKGTFQLPYFGTRRYSAVTSAKFAYTVVANEPAHGLNSWSLPSTIIRYDTLDLAHEKFRDMAANNLEFTRLTGFSGRVLQPGNSLATIFDTSSTSRVLVRTSRM